MVLPTSVTPEWRPYSLRCRTSVLRPIQNVLLHEVKGDQETARNERDASWGKGRGESGGAEELSWKHTGLRPLEKESDGASFENYPNSPRENGGLLLMGAAVSTCGWVKCIFKMWHPFQQNFEGQRLKSSTWRKYEWCEHEANRAFGWPIQCPGSWRKREPLNGALVWLASSPHCRVLNPARTLF